MKTIKQIIYIVAMILVTMSFSNCSSAQKLQEQAPFTINSIYSQGWVAGVEGGGSGINVFITTSELDKKIEMEGLYFNGKYVKLEKKNNLYIGRIKTAANQPKDIILDIDPKKEAANKVPEVKKEKTPFELADDEAVLTYKQNGTTKYFKVKNIEKKPMQALLSTPKNQNDKLIKQ